MIRYLKSTFIAFCVLWIGITSFPFPPDSVWAESASDNPGDAPAENIDSMKPSWLDQIDMRWGGRFKATGGIARANNDTFLAPVASGNQYDGSGDFRLINETFLSDWYYFEGAYELIMAGGDTRRARQQLRDRFPAFPSAPLFVSAQLNDDRRLLDLTDTIKENDNTIIFQRLDRLFLAMFPSCQPAHREAGDHLGQRSDLQPHGPL